MYGGLGIGDRGSGKRLMLTGLKPGIRSGSGKPIWHLSAYRGASCSGEVENA